MTERSLVCTAAANAAQAGRWNGESGQYWVKHHARHLTEQQNLTPHLFRAAGISPGERVLDIGCGCGYTTLEAAQAAANSPASLVSRPDERRVGAGAVGVDLSAPALDMARQLAAERATANVDFILGDAQIYPFCPNSFEIAISSFGVMFFSNPAEAFKNMMRAVCPGGRLAFLCWKSGTENEVLEIPLHAFRAHIDLPDTGKNKLFFCDAEIEKLLIRSGWTPSSICSLSEEARIGSDVTDVMGYVRDMPSVRKLVANLNDESLTEKILGEVKEQYAARARPDGVWANAAAWLVTAVRS